MIESDAPLKAILIGLGMMGQNHLRVLCQSGDYELLGVADEDANKAWLAGDVPFATDHRALPLSNADVIFVATPTVTHHELIASLASVTAHIFVEKPIFDCVSRAQEMRLLIDPKRLSVGHVERFNPAILKLRQLVSGGRLGKVSHCAFTRGGSLPRNVNQSRNVIIDLAVHDIDLFRWFFGDAEVISAAKNCRQGNIIHTSDILLRSATGTTASIHSSWIMPTRVRTLRLTGTHGDCFVDMVKSSCELQNHGLPSTDDGFSPMFSAIQAEPLTAQLRDLTQRLRFGRGTGASFFDAVASLAIAEEALRL